MRTLWVATIAAAMLAASAVGVAGQTEEPQATPESLLFIGNSFTYWNDGVETHVAALAASEDPPRTIEADPHTMGGVPLKSHAMLVSSTGIRDGDHDVVILQGDIPENPPGDVEPFFESARLLDQEIRDAGGRTVFYMTWPFLPADWIGHDGIEAAHRQIEEELGVTVAPVGMAMIDSLIERPGLDMLGPDLGHPTIKGTYLAAAVIYATVFDRSPEGLSYRPDGVTEEEAAYLQRIAWEALRSWRDGAMSPAPDAGAWVTGTSFCNPQLSPPARVTFRDGAWAIRGLSLICQDRASDPRVSGRATSLWNCDCQFGVGSPTWGTYEILGPEGSWVGTYRGTRAVDGTGHSFVILEGTDAYEGLTYMVDGTNGESGPSDIEGVIYEGDPPPSE